MTTFATAYSTIDFALVTREGSGRKAKHDFSNSYRDIQAGDWLAWRSWGTLTNELWPSYYWHVVAGADGALVLQTPWGSHAVALTQELAEELCFTTSSSRLPLTDFTEEARWFAGCHWAMKFTDSEEGVYMHLDKFGVSRGGITGEMVPPEALGDRGRLRTYLLNALYQLTHPALYERRPEGAKQLSEAELAKFTREVSRKAEKRGLS